MTTSDAPYDAVLPLGPFAVGLRAAGDALVRVELLPPRPALAPTGALAAEAVRQLQAYARDPRIRFDLPLAPGGTPFQRRVWAALAEIPPGQRRSYGELARRLGSSARAVGGACRANPIALIVPCHRVVAAQGPGGYAGHSAGPVLERKLWLLTHEGAL